MRLLTLLTLLFIFGIGSSIGYFFYLGSVKTSEEDYRTIYQPANFNAKVSDVGIVNLSWEIMDAKADGFNIYFSETPRKPNEVLVNYVDTHKLRKKSLIISNIIPIRKYYFWIEGYNTAGKSPLNQTVVENTKFPLRTIQSIETIKHADKIEFKWKDNNRLHSGYSVGWKGALEGDQFYRKKNIPKDQKNITLSSKIFPEKKGLYTLKVTPYLIHKGKIVYGNKSEIYFRLDEIDENSEKFFEDFPTQEKLNVSLSIKKLGPEDYEINWEPLDFTVHGYKLYQSIVNKQPDEFFAQFPLVKNSVVIKVPHEEERYFWIEAYRGFQSGKPQSLLIKDDHLDTINNPIRKFKKFKRNIANGEIEVKNDIDVILLNTQVSGSYYLEITGLELDVELFNAKGEKIPIEIVPTENSLSQTYSFKIRSKTDYFFVFKSTQNKTGKYKLKYYRRLGSWKQIVKNKFFRPLSGHQTIFHNGQVIILGGTYKNKVYNEIWVSEDLMSWEKATTSLNIFSPRTGHQVIRLGDKFWMYGGKDIGRKVIFNDIWSSSDGISWQLEVLNANFAPRFNHKVVEFNDQLFMIGGEGSRRRIYSDIWVSTDGINWKLINTSAPMGGISEHSLTEFKDQLYLIGGRDERKQVKDHIWISRTGKDWVKLRKPAFPGRAGHSAIVYNNNLFVIAGLDKQNRLLRDVWVTLNGLNWAKEGTVGFSSHYDSSVILFQDNFAVIGGRGKSQLNDVWLFDPQY